MKKVNLIFLLAVSLCACTEKNNPNDPTNPEKETGYRLDSIIAYNDDVLERKVVYYYSKSIQHYDYSHSYNWYNNQWGLSSKESCKYDENWNVIEETYSNYNDSQWIVSYTELMEYNQKGEQRTFINYDSGGEEIDRTVSYWEFDSLGYVTVFTSETYLHDMLVESSVTKYDNYYTNNYLDSVYYYVKNNSQPTYECGGKYIYLLSNDSNISVTYNYQDNQFVLLQKIIQQYDSQGNATLSELYRWENNEWSLIWLFRFSYEYVDNTNLIKEMLRVGTDYNRDGTITKTNKREKYYYTKL